MAGTFRLAAHNHPCKGLLVLVCVAVDCSLFVFPFKPWPGCWGVWLCTCLVVSVCLPSCCCLSVVFVPSLDFAACASASQRCRVL